MKKENQELTVGKKVTVEAEIVAIYEDTIHIKIGSKILVKNKNEMIQKEQSLPNAVELKKASGFGC